MTRIAQFMCVGALTSCFARGAHAQSNPPSYGIDFITVGSPGNPACTLTDPDGVSFTTGRGRVNYEYRIGRTEITTGQWLQFVNTFSVLGGSWTGFAEPNHWGAEVDPGYIGPGVRYRLNALPGASELPVAGVSWRTAAMYCNWLCNNQSGSPGALDHGAYNTDTFSTNPDQTFNDQLTHTPGAAFWIPTLDEWLKAAHFDPNKFGAGQGGWWQYPNRSDVALNYGPPGEGQANAGFTLPDFGQWSIPLTSYPATLSAWGMLDSAGGSAEWLEDALGQGGPRYRGVEGSYAGLGLYLSELNDRATRFYSDSPHIAASYQGFRIASIPCPATALMGVMLIPGVTLRRRRP